MLTVTSCLHFSGDRDGQLFWRLIHTNALSFLLLSRRLLRSWRLSSRWWLNIQNMWSKHIQRSMPSHSRRGSLPWTTERTSRLSTASWKKFFGRFLILLLLCSTSLFRISELILLFRYVSIRHRKLEWVCTDFSKASLMQSWTKMNTGVCASPRVQQ